VHQPERELKVTAAPSFRMPELEGLGDGLVAVPWEPELLSTVYFDTEDLRLARWGASLRHRLGQGWTVKLPADKEGDLLVRPEITFAGGPKRPPADVCDVVRAFTRTRTLQPRTRLRTTRRRTELRDGGGHLVADVFEDDVAVTRGRRVAAEFREIEVEVGEHTRPELLDALAARLCEAGADGADPTPKYIRSLGPQRIEPEVAVDELGRDATAADVVRCAIAASVVRLVVHDPIVRLDIDPEGVHQARVATRRLRSDLRTFRRLVEPEHAAELRAELRWLGSTLGAVRDGDVLLERMRESATRLPVEHAAGAAEVIRTLEADRDAAHAALLATMRDRRYLDLLDTLVAEANAPALQPDAERAAGEVVPKLVRRPWRSLAKAAAKLRKKPSDAELHQLRIRTKRVRYAAEAVSPVVGRSARALARAAADLQGVLGDLNDAVVAERWLASWSDARPSGPGVAAAVLLAENERQEAKQLRSEWKRAWKTLADPKLRAWM
jgi:CHAD domain-containing protein